MHADVVLSENIDEFILGYNSLVENNCEWLFSKNLVVINGVSVQLHSRATKPSVRRIFVRESVSIPADVRANVPVRLPFVSLHAPRVDWLTEPREVRPGLLAARTLLADNDEYAAIQFINVSGVAQVIREGHPLDEATPCPSDHMIIRQVNPEPTLPSADGQEAEPLWTAGAEVESNENPSLGAASLGVYTVTDNMPCLLYTSPSPRD